MLVFQHPLLGKILVLLIACNSAVLFTPSSAYAADKPTRSECIIGFHLDWSRVKDRHASRDVLSIPHGRNRVDALEGEAISLDGSRLYLQFGDKCDTKQEMAESILTFWQSQSSDLPRFERIPDPIIPSTSSIDLGGSSWSDGTPPRSSCIVGFNVEWSSIETQDRIRNSLLNSTYNSSLIAAMQFSDDNSKLYLQFTQSCDVKHIIAASIIKEWQSKFNNPPKFIQLPDPIIPSASTINYRGSRWSDWEATHSACVVGYHLNWMGVSHPEAAQRAITFPKDKQKLESLKAIGRDVAHANLYLLFDHDCSHKDEFADELIDYWKSQHIVLPTFEARPVNQASLKIIDYSGWNWRD